MRSHARRLGLVRPDVHVAVRIPVHRDSAAIGCRGRTQRRRIGIDHLVGFPTGPIDPQELPLAAVRWRGSIGDGPGGRRGQRRSAGHVVGNRKRLSPEFQPIRDRSPAPAACPRGRTADAPVAAYTAGASASNKRVCVQSVELADIDATRFRAAGHEEEKVPAVGEELRERMTPLLRRLDSRRGNGFPTRGGDAENRPAGIIGEKDRAVAVPRAPERHRNAGGQRPHRSAVDVHPLQLGIRKEPDGPAVGRPERADAALGAWQRPSRRRIERPQPQTETGPRTWPRRRSSIHQAKSPATRPGRRRADFEADFRNRRRWTQARTPKDSGDQHDEGQADAHAKRSRLPDAGLDHASFRVPRRERPSSPAAHRGCHGSAASDPSAGNDAAVGVMPLGRPGRQPLPGGLGLQDVGDHLARPCRRQMRDGRSASRTAHTRRPTRRSCGPPPSRWPAPATCTPPSPESFPASWPSSSATVDRSWLRLPRQRIFARPKSSTFTVPSERDRDVGGLQIAMDDASVVRRFERFGDLPGNRQGFDEANRSAGDPIGECRALDQFHHQRRRSPEPFSRPWMCAMFGWFSAASTSASRWNRASRSASRATDPSSTLMATWRFRLVSVARYTSPMPPTPRGDRISYGPRRVPGCNGKG